MNEDLKEIKRKYGEKMSHLCKKIFPTILETKGLLPKLLEENFAESHQLCDDIINAQMVQSFKAFIYSKAQINFTITQTEKTPKELLEEAGYDFYECKTEEEINAFKKYYKESEELCTFEENRLKKCYVFWAVKKNVDEIKRENFHNPQRQDEYGTSVISIQFTKDSHQTLSIKNRYNHMVDNPDATFGNNLDNIIPGLTYAFEKTYNLIQNNDISKKEKSKHGFIFLNMIQENKNNRFNLDNYVRAGNGKLYKYNMCHNNIYYCPNNVIIECGEVVEFSKESYIVFDNFILDLKNKILKSYDPFLERVFSELYKDIKNIDIIKNKETKDIVITLKDKTKSTITIDKQNRFIGYKNDNIKELDDNFLIENEHLKEINLPNVIRIGNNFLNNNFDLVKINLPNVQTIGEEFLITNVKLKSLNLPSAKKIDNFCLLQNKNIKEIYMPNIQIIGSYFLESNKQLSSINLPNLKEVGAYFLYANENLKELILPNVQVIGTESLSQNKKINKIYLPKIRKIGFGFLQELSETKRTINISHEYKLERRNYNFELMVIDKEIKNKKENNEYEKKI